MLTTEGKLNFYFKASTTRPKRNPLVQTYAAWHRESTQVVEEGQEEQAVPCEYCKGDEIDKLIVHKRKENLGIHGSANKVAADGIVADNKVGERERRLGRLLERTIIKNPNSSYNFKVGRHKKL